MTVCLFGGYDGDHPRNRVILGSLRSAGFEVVECNDRTPNRATRIACLVRRFHSLRRRCDAILVGASGHPYTPVAWLLGRIYGKPVVLDAFVSYYECRTEDPTSTRLQRCIGFVIDWGAVRLADTVLIDTEQHADYYARLTGVGGKRIRAVRVGSDAETHFDAPAPPERPFRVVFAGGFLPLHGVETIIAAANILRNEPDLLFELIGGGEARQRLERECSAAPISFCDRVPYSDYLQRLARAHLALGVFGITSKTARVIPCKVYDAMAAGVPVITADVPAVRQLLRHGENAWLVPAGDAAALASAIRTLRQDTALRARLATEARSSFLRLCAREGIGETLRAILEPLMQPQRSTRGGPPRP